MDDKYIWIYTSMLFYSLLILYIIIQFLTCSFLTCYTLKWTGGEIPDGPAREGDADSRNVGTSNAVGSWLSSGRQQQQQHGHQRASHRRRSNGRHDPAGQGSQQIVGFHAVRHWQVLARRLSRLFHLLQSHVLDHLFAYLRRCGRRPRIHRQVVIFICFLCFQGLTHTLIIQTKHPLPCSPFIFIYNVYSYTFMAHKEIGEKGRADSNRVDLYKSNISGKKQTNECWWCAAFYWFKPKANVYYHTDTATKGEIKMYMKRVSDGAIDRVDFQSRDAYTYSL